MRARRHCDPPSGRTQKVVPPPGGGGLGAGKGGGGGSPRKVLRLNEGMFMSGICSHSLMSWVSVRIVEFNVQTSLEVEAGPWGESQR